jgi:hypothetical protein
MQCLRSTPHSTRTTIPVVSIVIEGVGPTGFRAATMTGTNKTASSAGSASWSRRRLAAGKEMPRADLMPACHLRHDRARRKRFRDDPPLVRVTPPSPATNATANLNAPSRRGSVNCMVDHICEPMPSTGSHLRNYAARCKMGAKHRLRYVAGETRSFARDIGLEPRTTPIESPRSNGMVEAFVRTIKLRPRQSVPGCTDRHAPAISLD